MSRRDGWIVNGFVGCAGSFIDVFRRRFCWGTEKNYAAGSMAISFASEDADKGMRCDATTRIVHVGDCMGMLVRGENIVWRTEEMWLNVRTCPLPFPFSLLSSLISFPLFSFCFSFLYMPFFFSFRFPPFGSSLPSSLSFLPPFLLPSFPLLSSLIVTPLSSSTTPQSN